MKRRFLQIAFLLIAALVLQAQEKIAVVDVEQVFKEFYKTKIVEANLKRQADIYKNYTVKLNESLVKLKEEFKTLRDSSQNLAFSDAVRENKRLAATEKYNQIMAKEQEIKEYTRVKLAQLRDDRDRERERILIEIRKVIERQAIIAGYTIVLDKSGSSISSFPLVLYHSKSINITGAVIKELNLGHTTTQNKEFHK